MLCQKKRIDASCPRSLCVQPWRCLGVRRLGNQVQESGVGLERPHPPPAEGKLEAVLPCYIPYLIGMIRVKRMRSIPVRPHTVHLARCTSLGAAI